MPVGNPEALCEAMLQLMALGLEVRHLSGQKARSCIEQHFSLEAITTNWQSLYMSLAQKKGLGYRIHG